MKREQIREALIDLLAGRVRYPQRLALRGPILRTELPDQADAEAFDEECKRLVEILERAKEVKEDREAKVVSHAD